MSNKEKVNTVRNVFDVLRYDGLKGSFVRVKRELSPKEIHDKRNSDSVRSGHGSGVVHGSGGIWIDPYEEIAEGVVSNIDYSNNTISLVDTLNRPAWDVKIDDIVHTIQMPSGSITLSSIGPHSGIIQVKDKSSVVSLRKAAK